MNRVMTVERAPGIRTYGDRNPYAAARLSGLGDDSQDMGWLGILGFSAGQVQTILQKHASGALSDAGYQAILQGQVSPVSLAQFLNQDPGAPESGSAGTAAQSASTASAAAASAASSGTAGVPTGSLITYQCQLPGAFFSSAADIVNRVSGVLPGLGLTLVNSQVQNQGVLNSPSTVILTVRVSGPGFMYVGDAQAQIDHAVYAVAGQMPTTSAAVVSGVPGASGNPSAPSGTSLATWFEANAAWIFLGIGAMVLLPNLIGGRR